MLLTKQAFQLFQKKRSISKRFVANHSIWSLFWISNCMCMQKYKSVRIQPLSLFLMSQQVEQYLTRLEQFFPKET